MNKVFNAKIARLCLHLSRIPCVWPTFISEVILMVKFIADAPFIKITIDLD